MSVAIVTGSAGLIGSEAVRLFAAQGLDVVGIDNDMRRVFFGAEASTAWCRQRLEAEVPRYTHVDLDIRDHEGMEKVFARHGSGVAVIVHTAAQPSHDWAASDPLTDFSINANGTHLLLDLARRHCPDGVFIFTSTNKVYGDRPNALPFVERDMRWEISPDHPYSAHGIDEGMNLDQTLHSLFGASKVSADILVQEYGRYFGMRTACFRGGCLTGPNHAGTRLHGFLAYLMKCALTGEVYTVLGYKGKQVRDNIHAHDLVNAFWHFFQEPRKGEVYNIGGGRWANCSVVEAIEACERIAGKSLNWTYSDRNRVGDHIWWISDNRRFEGHYPRWRLQYDIDSTLREIHDGLLHRVPSLS